MHQYRFFLQWLVRLTTSFIEGPLYFVETDPVDSATCKYYDNLLHNLIIPTTCDFQQRVCRIRILFVQFGSPLYITKSVMQLLQRHFRNNRVISRHFVTTWL